MNIAIIPARGGSKRIPGKNIRDFCGQPMIKYSIDAALRTTGIDRVVVSTDDEKIAQVARESGAEVPFMRPVDLSDDYTGTVPVIRHAIEQMQAQGESPEYVCCLYATAPFAQSKYLAEGLALLESQQASYAFSVTSFPFPVQRAVRVNAQGRVEALYPEHRQTRSQELEEAYHDAGQFYWGTAKAFCDEQELFAPHSIPVILPRHFVQDVDTPEDWQRAEVMYEVLRKQGMLS
ncbi:MAG: pseudaminic acid cytidylyltransferase [Kordiimonas sp.]|nr:pseudaminic acid cytidylyltransferase [Kordiimonas sp.]|tara:strand:+ start:607 stop:1308 length:702 start_codon:yes stop_codon:yes gene_type:complete